MNSPLLEIYQSRFGTAIKPQGNGWNGPCPLCGGEPGTSDRFVVWPERAENLGETCAKNNVTGIWSCRQCGRSGDTIAYLMQVDGLSFKAALAELGIEGERGGGHGRPRAAPQEPRRQAAFTPRECAAPSTAWQTYAAKLLDEATARIAHEPATLAWLANRGLTAEAVATYHIGYLPAEGNTYPGRWRSRSSLGLSPKTDANGKVRDKIFIPRGIVIPTFTASPAGGMLLNLRFRRHKEDLNPLPNGRKPPKYMELEGSCKASLLLRSTSPAPLAAYFVTEAELDAMLIHYATAGIVGAIAVRTNCGKPDASAHASLTKAVRVCVALDYDAELDEHGQERLPDNAPGTLGLDFWERTYPQYRRWPTPEGKDPGDAFRLGVNIREWVATALPPSVKLPDLPASESEWPTRRGAERHPDAGTVDALPSGLVDAGGGAEPKNTTPKNPEGREQPMRTSGDEAAPATLCEAATSFTTSELALLRTALPASTPLETIPADVLRAWLLWQGVPATFTKYRSTPDGASTGFSWDYDPAWQRAHPDRFETFWRFQNTSTRLWQWLSDHADTSITSRNLLHIQG